MRNLKPEHHLCHLSAWERLLEGCCHAFCKHLILCQLLVVHIEDVVNLAAWNNEGVTLCHWVDVEESVEFFALCALVAWYLSSCYL